MKTEDAPQSPHEQPMALNRSGRSGPRVSFGMTAALILSLAGCGFFIALLNLAGLTSPTNMRVPHLADLRPLIISSLGLVVLGLTPVMVRLFWEDSRRVRVRVRDRNP